MISYVITTRDRSRTLAGTLEQLSRLGPRTHEAAGGAELLLVDDASSRVVTAPTRLANGMPVRLIRTFKRRGAAARNAAARHARGEWLVMLDDDSWPEDAGVVAAIADAAPDVAAIGAEIRLADGRRERGGGPEVFVGCGVALRRTAFLEAGGYDPAFVYYAEEYDLAARLLARGWRVVHDWRFRVRHARSGEGRDVNEMLFRLVRNGGWVVARYAPVATRRSAWLRVLRRCRDVARREHASVGFRRGLQALRGTWAEQPRRPLDWSTWERLEGAAQVRATLRRVPRLAGRRVVIVDAGRGADVIRAVLRDDLGCTIGSKAGGGPIVIGTLSPGPMMDSRERRRSERPIQPWTLSLRSADR